MVSGKKLDMSNGTTKYRDQASNMAFNNRKDTGGGKAQNGNASSFRTDSAISSGKSHGQRELQKWKAPATDGDDLSLESSMNGRVGDWDQFRENETRFNIKTTYREDIYTTPLDRSDPQYKQKYAMADKKAREIEGSATAFSHVAEERIKDNLATGGDGDEEDKYSGVRRQQDFPPLLSSNDGNKYTPPARRAPTGQSTVSGAPVDPAIISSQLAKPTGEKVKPLLAPKAPPKPLVATPPTTTESSVTATPDTQSAAPVVTPASSSRTASTARAEATPNATATVERDVASAFRGFASKERKNVEQLRSAKARNDKEIKLTELKKFADSFKLLTPVPSDLVCIIAKDPAKQKEIQERAKRNAEEAKINPPDSSKAVTPAADSRVSQRPVPAAHGPSAPSTANRQGPLSNRTQNFQHGQYPPQGFRGANQPRGGQLANNQQVAQPGNLGARLQPYNKSGPGQINHIPPYNNHEIRQPPTGPSNHGDSRRPSVASAQGAARFNVTAKEFQPNAAAPPFNPSVNPSSGSSPRSVATPAEPQQPNTPAPRSLLRRKPIPDSERPDITKVFNTMDFLKTYKTPAGKEAAWAQTGGLKPAYDTPLLWRTVATEGEDEKSTMQYTYTQLFENNPFPSQNLVSPNPAQNISSIPLQYQHQLPLHMQGGIQHMPPRGSPRQPAMNMHGNQHLHGPNQSFNGGEDHHRMMNSQSAQSFSSPRPSPAIPFPSPMNQSSHMFNAQMGMPFHPGAPPMQQGLRSLSQNHQFPSQQGHMAPMMMQNPVNGFMPQGMGPGNQGIMFAQGQGHFMQPGTGHAPVMPGVNGYPSPGRGAPMMMNQGSQQGHQQPMYGMNQGMSPGPQYGNLAPIYAQQAPGQQMPMRGYPGPNQFGTSPQQMHQFQQHRNNGNHQNGNYSNNKNFQHQGQQHLNGPPNQVPTGPQARPTEGSDEAK